MIIHEEPRHPSSLTPGVSSCYGNGIGKLGKYFLPLLLVLLVTAVFSIPSYISSFLSYSDVNYAIVMVILYIYSFFILVPVEYGLSFAFLKAARDERPSVNDLAVVLKNYGNILLVTFLRTVIVTIGFFLLIIPGFYFAFKLSFVQYLVTDKHMSAFQAIDESWRMTSGHVGTIFLMWLLAIPIMFAGLLMFGIGAIFSAMWVETAFASLYHAVSLENQIEVIDSAPTQPGPFV